MAQAVSHRPFTAKAQIRARSVHVGFVVNKVTLEQVFVPSPSVFFCQYHSIATLHTHIISGMNDRPIGGSSSETKSHPIDMNDHLAKISVLQ
jgi:hypothetical protein